MNKNTVDTMFLYGATRLHAVHIVEPLYAHFGRQVQGSDPHVKGMDEKSDTFFLFILFIYI